MWHAFLIIALYVLGMSLFHWVGGLASAADAFMDWGRTSAEKRRKRLSL